MGKAARNHRIRSQAREIDPKHVKSISRRLRKNRNTTKYDSHGGKQE